MEDLDYDLKTQLYNHYFVELETLLKVYHNRKTKISVGNRLNIIKDHKRPKSLVLGVRSPFFLSARKDKTLNPHISKHTQTEIGHRIYELCYTIISMVYPNFDFNQIIINFNTDFLIHKDSRNRDPDSVIFSVGDHDGGGLNIYDDDKNLIKTLDIWKNPTRFAGKTTYHSTEEIREDILGRKNRWSVVAYRIKTNKHYDPYERELLDY